MNKRVMHTVLGVLWLFLLLFSLAKIFIPEQLVASIDKPHIIALGTRIEACVPIKLLIDTCVGILTYHFYLCACCRVWRLKVKHYALLTVYSFVVALGYIYAPQISLVLDLAALISFPTMLYARLKQLIPVFILHQAGQLLLLHIRSEALFLAGENYAVKFILVFDVYIWLAIYYLHSNMCKEETLWDFLVSRFSMICRKLSLRKNSKK